jgi:hypothetical protein
MELADGLGYQNQLLCGAIRFAQEGCETTGGILVDRIFSIDLRYAPMRNWGETNRGTPLT